MHIAQDKVWNRKSAIYIGGVGLRKTSDREVLLQNHQHIILADTYSYVAHFFLHCSLRIRFKITYGNTQGPPHGGTGASATSFTLEADEFITYVSLHVWNSDDQFAYLNYSPVNLTFQTDKGRVHGPYGSSGTNPLSNVGKFYEGSGYRLAALAGTTTKDPYAKFNALTLLFNGC